LIEENISYAPYLLDNGVSFEKRYPWLYVGNTDHIQGWKIHLSSIQTEATSLLQKIIPLLKKTGHPFKVAMNEKVLSLLNEGLLGETQVGKFATIYFNNTDNLPSFAEQLCKLTKGFHGPVILTDVCLGDVVYARYGAYNPVISYN